MLAGDSLWSLAARHLGPGADATEVAEAWPRWWEANRAVVGDDPDLLLPGPAPGRPRARDPCTAAARTARSHRRRTRPRTARPHRPPAPPDPRTDPTARSDHDRRPPRAPPRLGTPAHRAPARSRRPTAAPAAAAPARPAAPAAPAHVVRGAPLGPGSGCGPCRSPSRPRGRRAARPR